MSPGPNQLPAKVLKKLVDPRRSHTGVPDREEPGLPRRTITSAELKAIREFKNDDEIVIVPADKGRATVVLDKSEYVAKAQQLLNDNQSYKVIDADPMKALVGKINKSLN
nr:unnamed protein product [Spirometra erinaceieuropaei]